MAHSPGHKLHARKGLEPSTFLAKPECSPLSYPALLKEQKPGRLGSRPGEDREENIKTLDPLKSHFRFLAASFFLSARTSRNASVCKLFCGSAAHSPSGFSSVAQRTTRSS